MAGNCGAGGRGACWFGAIGMLIVWWVVRGLVAAFLFLGAARDEAESHMRMWHERCEGRGDNDVDVGWRRAGVMLS